MKQLDQKLIDRNKYLEEQISELRDTNARLERSNKNLIGVYSAMADGLIIINGKGLISELNPTAEDIFGYSQKELIETLLSIFRASLGPMPETVVSIL